MGWIGASVGCGTGWRRSPTDRQRRSRLAAVTSLWVCGWARTGSGRASHARPARLRDPEGERRAGARSVAGRSTTVLMTSWERSHRGYAAELVVEPLVQHFVEVGGSGRPPRHRVVAETVDVVDVLAVGELVDPGRPHRLPPDGPVVVLEDVGGEEEVWPGEEHLPVAMRRLRAPVELGLEEHPTAGLEESETPFQRGVGVHQVLPHREGEDRVEPADVGRWVGDVADDEADPVGGNVVPGRITGDVDPDDGAVELLGQLASDPTRATADLEDSLAAQIERPVEASRAPLGLGPSRRFVEPAGFRDQRPLAVLLVELGEELEIEPHRHPGDRISPLDSHRDGVRPPLQAGPIGGVRVSSGSLGSRGSPRRRGVVHGARLPGDRRGGRRGVVRRRARPRASQGQGHDRPTRPVVGSASEGGEGVHRWRRPRPAATDPRSGVAGRPRARDRYRAGLHGGGAAPGPEARALLRGRHQSAPDRRRAGHGRGQ